MLPMSIAYKNHLKFTYYKLKLILLKLNVYI